MFRTASTSTLLSPHVSAPRQAAQFRRWLVEDPQGWDESGVPGSVRYREGDLDTLLGPDGDATVMIVVGRFTEAKRVPLLVEAFARARAAADQRLSLLVWGGHPGEWEGEHPVTVARRHQAEGIYFAGWRGHERLPEGLAACDVLVMPSVNDPYPQTPLEAMAVGLPVIATRSGGFPSMVNLDPRTPTGWLVPPDDVDDPDEILVEAVETPGELARRGAAALAHARAPLLGRPSGRLRARIRACSHSAVLEGARLNHRCTDRTRRSQRPADTGRVGTIGRVDANRRAAAANIQV
jgi:glycosyltransferase involved in cell wall biosynthesis